MKKKDKQDQDNIIKEARERARDGATYWKENLDMARDDLEFLSGNQWDESTKTKRQNDGQPCLVNNVLPTFVDQVLGDQRQNKPSIKIGAVEPVIVPDVDTGKPTTQKISNVAGGKDYEIAEVYQALIRNIEYNCDADDGYDMAFQSAVQSGIGYLRVLTDYSTKDSFEQDIKIKVIDNQFSVTIDPMAKSLDKSDMNWCLVDDIMLKEVFEKKYPGKASQPIPSDNQPEDNELWFPDGTVRVTEYFTREEYDREVILMSDGQVLDAEEAEPILDEMAQGAFDENGVRQPPVTEVKRRKVKAYRVMWRKITGIDVLEGPIELDCSYIPIVPVYGKSLAIKGRRIYQSIIRHSKDAQRMINYWDSAAAESVGLSSKAKWIGTVEQFEGLEGQWENANTSNQAYLAYNDVPGKNQPSRIQEPQVPMAELALSGTATDKVKATMGMFDASVGAAGNETSGKAILARQREADVGTFAFIDNLSKSIRQVGRILVEMIPKVYDTERVIRLKFPDDTEDFVKINRQIEDEETGEYITINDLSVIKCDVAVSTGPAYTTQREETAEKLLDIMKTLPQAGQVGADIFIQNVDFEGNEELAKRLKKLLPPGMLSQGEVEEMQEGAPQPEGPTPEQVAAEMENKKLQMELQKQQIELEATQAESQAKIAQAEADALEAQKELAMLQQGGSDAITQMVREQVAKALVEAQVAPPNNL